MISRRKDERSRENIMSVYAPKQYWTTLAERFKSADAFGFAPVLHPMTPTWFNESIDRLQLRAMRRALRVAALPPGARALDIGCGTGRWIRRFAEMGFQPIGIDPTNSDHLGAPLKTQ